MVSLQGQSKPYRTSNKINTETGTTSTSSLPHITSVSTRKETNSKGDAVTTITTTTTIVRASSNAALNTGTPSGAGSLTKSAKGGRSGNVSPTTITTTHIEDGSSPVTIFTVDNGVNSTSTTMTERDAHLDATAVTTTTDSKMSGPARRSSKLTNARGRSAATSSQKTSIGSNALASTSTTSQSLSAKATNEEKAASITNAGRTRINSETSAGATTAVESTNSYNDSAIATAPHSATSTPASTASSNGPFISTEITKTSSTAAGNSPTSTVTSPDVSSTASSSSESMTMSSSRSSSSLSSSDSLGSWFVSNFRNYETQLAVGGNSSETTASVLHQVCNGFPALITRSKIEPPNGSCPDEFTALNASCTCLTGYGTSASSWSFRVTTKSRNFAMNSTMRATTQSSSDELAIDIIRPIWVPSSLKTLTIESTDEYPAQITFIDENRTASTSSLPLVRSVSNSTQISTLSLSNLDLNSVAATKSNFVPVTVTNLTLQNCNISTLGSSFTRTWGQVQYLDLSSNKISTEFVGGDALKELNLSHNALAVFPVGSLKPSSLEALYIQGNDIRDFNVSQDQFNQIQALQAFKSDKPSSSSTCQNGAWQTAHNTTFCVHNVSTAAAPDLPQSSGSTSDGVADGLGVLSYWLMAGAIVVFFLLLLVIWQRRRHSRESESSPVLSPEAIEPTTPMYNANHAFGDALNHDNVNSAVPAAVGATINNAAAQAFPGYGRPYGNSVDNEDTTAMGMILATDKTLASCRLDHGDLILGRCVSRGGFGLVFVGSYRGRQVAIKKIRNERDIERSQVEQFVREISLISGLNHPRIVEFIGACWTTPVELSAVTEFMERGDLRDVTRRFKRRGYRLSWESHKADIALHIAEALTYLHGLTPTMIHRDLKAKNVMLNADMEAKLSDFGIARERSSYDGSEPMTMGIGTSFWIAPEVLFGRDYDERADIYSFGVVLSEIDTDDYPYWNEQHPPQGKAQENEILRLVARGAKRPEFSNSCPPAILELASRCLRTDPEERPSAFEIVLYLQQLVQDRNSSASFSSMVRAETAFDCTKNNADAAAAEAKGIVTPHSIVQANQQPQEIVSSSIAEANAPGKFCLKKTVTTTTAKTASLSITTMLRPTEAKALVSAQGATTHPVASPKSPANGRGTRRDGQSNTSSIFDRVTISIAGGIENGRSSQSYTDARPSSPTSLQDIQQTEFSISRQQQLSSSSGKDATVVRIDRRRQSSLLDEDSK